MLLVTSEIEPKAEVPTKVETVTFASASMDIVPNAEVPALGAVSVTGIGSPQVSCPQVPRPQPVMLAI